MRITEPGLVCHVLNRRVMRLPLFLKDEDYLAFERVLAPENHPDTFSGPTFSGRFGLLGRIGEANRKTFVVASIGDDADALPCSFKESSCF